MKKGLLLCGLLLVGCSNEEVDFSKVTENMNGLNKFQMNASLVISGEGNSNDNITIVRKSNDTKHEVSFSNLENSFTTKFISNDSGLNAVNIDDFGYYNYSVTDEVFYSVDLNNLLNREYTLENDVYKFVINEEEFNDLISGDLFFPTGDVTLNVTLDNDYVKSIEINDSFVYHEKNVTIDYEFNYSEINTDFEISVPENGSIDPSYAELEDKKFDIEHYIFEVENLCQLEVCPNVIDVSTINVMMPEGVSVDGLLTYNENGISGKFKFNEFTIEVINSRLEY